jgi:hypothetical protein
VKAQNGALEGLSSVGRRFPTLESSVLDPAPAEQTENRKKFTNLNF